MSAYRLDISTECVKAAKPMTTDQDCMNLCKHETAGYFEGNLGKISSCTRELGRLSQSSYLMPKHDLSFH